MNERVIDKLEGTTEKGFIKMESAVHMDVQWMAD